MPNKGRGAFAVEKVLAKFMEERDLSAGEIARKARCSLAAVYRRIDKLRELGASIRETREPRKKPGPTPTKYRLMRFAL